MARIMIVDDSGIMRLRIGEMLKNAGHEVVSEASNGMAAYWEYERHKPDLVTMDISMQGMDGIEAVKRIVTDFPDARIIMVSALEQKNMILTALEYGAKHYIIKPFQDNDILAKVEQVLRDNGPGQRPTIGKLFPEYPPEPQSHPLRVENKNGVFVIDMNDIIQHRHLNLFKHFSESLILISPLQLVFNFQDRKTIERDDCDLLASILNKIASANGNIRLVAYDPDFTVFLHKRFPLFGKIQQDLLSVKF